MSAAIIFQKSRLPTATTFKLTNIICYNLGAIPIDSSKIRRGRFIAIVLIRHTHIFVF